MPSTPLLLKDTLLPASLSLGWVGLWSSQGRDEELYLFAFNGAVLWGLFSNVSPLKKQFLGEHKTPPHGLY